MSLATTPIVPNQPEHPHDANIYLRNIQGCNLLKAGVRRSFNHDCSGTVNSAQIRTMYLLGTWLPLCWERLFPFQNRNRIWIIVLLKMYLFCMFLNLIIAAILYGIGGTHGPNRDENDDNPNMSYDECVWFVFTTFHSVAFGECILLSDGARFIGCFISLYGYFFQELSFCVILLSQLGGVRAPTVLSVPMRMCSMLWPSFLLYVVAVLSLGMGCTPFLNSGNGSAGIRDGLYFGWCVAFGNPYGDLYPMNIQGRAITGLLDVISYLYRCYIIAIMALRKPTREEHETLLSVVASGKHEEESLAQLFGPGYIAPSTVAPRVPNSAIDTVELA